MYAITPTNLSTSLLCEQIEQAVQGGVTIVQLREKNVSGKAFFEKALAVKNVLKKYRVPLIINDRVDVALAVNADGIHVGQNDLPVERVKQIVPSEMIVGVSARTVEEALIAEQAGADYLGVGSLFATKTKQNAVVIEQTTFESIMNQVKLPVVAIGGITMENVQQLSSYPIAGVAVISAIFGTDSVKETSKQFREKLLNICGH